MRKIDIVGIIGGGLLVAGISFGVFDPRLSDRLYRWAFGSFSWMMGCSLVVAWAFGRLYYPADESYRLKQRKTGTGSIAESSLEPTQQHTSERRQEERRKSKFAA